MSFIEHRGPERGFCTTENALKIVAFTIVVVLLSLNLWFTVKNGPHEQSSPPSTKTLISEETSKLIAEAVRKEREKWHRERHKDDQGGLSGGDASAKPDMEKDEVAYSKEPDISDNTCGGGDGDVIFSSVSASEVDGDNSCSGKGDVFKKDEHAPENSSI